MSQADLARLVGVSQQTIAKAERGKLRLRFDIQERIAAVLGSSRDAIFPAEEAIAS